MGVTSLMRNMEMLREYRCFMHTEVPDRTWRDNSSMKRQKNTVFGLSRRIVPGWGNSTYLENRTLLDYPSDISELADALDIDKFGVMGWSGGGAHTTVCGYAIPERLRFNFSFAGYTNFAELPGAENT